MGGFTQVFLKDKTKNNIDKHNALLRLYKVPKQYRFYSESDVIFEYEAFKMGLGAFPERQFPKDKINSLEDFKQYWSSEALGEVFVPPYGTLQFDCYFGRTSKSAMRKIGKYLVDNAKHIEKTEGSFSTFVERSGISKLGMKILEERNLL